MDRKKSKRNTVGKARRVDGGLVAGQAKRQGLSHAVTTFRVLQHFTCQAKRTVAAGTNKHHTVEGHLTRIISKLLLLLLLLIDISLT